MNVNKRLHFTRLYRTKPCRNGIRCKFRDKTCLYYHSKIEQRKPKDIKIPLTYDTELNISPEKLKQLVLNVIKLANVYHRYRQLLLFKTKMCRYSNYPEHNRHNCSFAHHDYEIQKQNIHVQKPFRVSTRQLECALLRLEIYINQNTN